MYTAVPGRTYLVAICTESTKKVTEKPVRKPATPYSSGMFCSAKGGPRVRTTRDDYHFKSSREIGQERRKCQRTHLRRRDADIYRTA